MSPARSSNQKENYERKVPLKEYTNFNRMISLNSVNKNSLGGLMVSTPASQANRHGFETLCRRALFFN